LGLPAEKLATLNYAVLLYSELTRCFVTWDRIPKGWNVTHSIIATRMLDLGRAEGDLRTQRRAILELLGIKFPGEASAEVVQLIEQQESLDLLHGWFRALARSSDYAEFLAHLRR